MSRAPDTVSGGAPGGGSEGKPAVYTIPPGMPFADALAAGMLAWTSGDLEQRVGRVDRFFSQIERRLKMEGAPPDVTLQVGYPHVVTSLNSWPIWRMFLVVSRYSMTEVREMTFNALILANWVSKLS